jgi:uncharacterized protein (TIGR03435 family)
LAWVPRHELQEESNVRDRPGLAARPDAAANLPPTNRPDIFTAVREQLGLKLDSHKGAVEVMIIDHVERPSEN